MKKLFLVSIIVLFSLVGLAFQSKTIEPEVSVQPQFCMDDVPAEVPVYDYSLTPQRYPRLKETNQPKTYFYRLANRHSDLSGVYLRTNLIYDGFMVPTFGAEWRPDNKWGVKFDCGFSFWGDETGDVQKILLLNPEIRRYFGRKYNYFLGLGGNYAHYNCYGFLLGSFFSENTGYQGELFNLGVTFGYQFRLAYNLFLELSIGAGYTKMDYDSFNITRETRLFKAQDQSKSIFGPTQAGVIFIWRIPNKNW